MKKITFIIILVFVSLYVGNLYASSSDAVKIGISSIVSAETNLSMYEGLAEYISKMLNKKTEVVYRKNYSDMNMLIENSKVDVAFVCTGAYSSLDEKKIDILVVPQVAGKTTYNSVLIVNKDSNITDLKSLRNKTIAFTDPLSNTGYIYPVYLLLNNNIRNRSYFKKVYYTYSHDKSIILVNKGVVDAAFVDIMIYEYLNSVTPQKTKNIKVIHISEDFPMPPVVVSYNYKDKERLRDIFLNMHKDEEGRKILKKINIDKFEVITKERYNIIKKMKMVLDEHFKNESSEIF
ncbi:MAG: phosphate/phosphite/phosphonate ABC transporter substrate-binding protein [Deferribacterales bacterium]